MRLGLRIDVGLPGTTVFNKVEVRRGITNELPRDSRLASDDINNCEQRNQCLLRELRTERTAKEREDSLFHCERDEQQGNGRIGGCRSPTNILDKV